ncbi:MAG: YicC family protein [Bacteroidales bacterium]|nr:YicC family protein [Bacteroidales bacterium]
MKSMTGFAKRQCTINDKKYNIEIKTLNSKQMDTIVKLPSDLKEHELQIRTMLNRLERGKIDFNISEEQSSATTVHLDADLARRRYEEVCRLSESLEGGTDRKMLLSIVLQQPDIWVGDNEQDFSDDEWQQLADAIMQTIDELDATRVHEGGILQTDFVKHLDLIEHYLEQIPQYESERIDTAKERMRTMLADSAVKEVDQNRFEQELIYYFEKLDITEEKVRLKKHIDYFRQVMADEEGSGKKLGFIAQEMGREINTTGSKANHIQIQRLVVAMKDELEKIKEQLGNIL